MSEAYLIQGDAHAIVNREKVAAQTFHPLETHVLQWVDLELSVTSRVPHHFILIYEANDSHEPEGDYIARDRYWFYPYWYSGPFVRVRFSMQEVTLHPDKEYVMVVGYTAALFEQPLWLKYLKNVATYPRGHRLYSTDHGVTWTHYSNDDHIFAEFGKPPTLEPEPMPPIQNVAPISLTYQCTATGYRILAVTNVPAHLYMVWTAIPPDKHKHPLFRRGSAFTTQLQYCFVAWEANEQLEEGDTVYHTFIKEPWDVCETRWFTFRAKVDDGWSPSVGPIFKKHKTETNSLTISGTASNRDVYKTHANWPPCHDATTGTLSTNWDAPFFLIQSGTRLTASHWIWRGFLFFPPFALPPGKTICNATLRLWDYADWHSAAPYNNLILTRGHQHDPVIPEDYGGQLTELDRLGQADLASFTAGQYNDVPFNINALNHINPTATTKLCLRGEMDVINRGAIFVYDAWMQYHSQQKGPNFAPKLVITYE